MCFKYLDPGEKRRFGRPSYYLDAIENSQLAGMWPAVAGRAVRCRVASRCDTPSRGQPKTCASSRGMSERPSIGPYSAFYDCDEPGQVRSGYRKLTHPPGLHKKFLPPSYHLLQKSNRP